MELSSNTKITSKYIESNGKKYEVIDNKSLYGETLKNNGAKVIIAVKSEHVIARPAKPGEEICTYSGDGTLETKSVAGKDSYIITKADKEGKPILGVNGNANVYMISGEVLRRRYDIKEDFSCETILTPKYIEQEFVQIDRNVAFMMPWGENGSLVPQLVNSGGYMNLSNPRDIYGIPKVDFEDTYKVVREVIVDAN